MLRGMGVIGGCCIFWLIGCLGGRGCLVENRKVNGMEREEKQCVFLNISNSEGPNMRADNVDCSRADGWKRRWGDAGDVCLGGECIGCG